MGNFSENRLSLSSAVQWCLCVFALTMCGYSLVQQQRLEERLKVLEDWHLRIEDTAYSFHQTKEITLKRSIREVADCICPSELMLQKKWKGIRGCFTREIKRQEKLRLGENPGPRKSEYTHFQQLQFLRTSGASRESSEEASEYIYYEEPDSPITEIKLERNDDPLKDESSNKVNVLKYDSSDADEIECSRNIKKPKDDSSDDGEVEYSRNTKKPKDDSSDDDEFKCSRNSKKSKDNSSDDDEVECSRNSKKSKDNSSDDDEVECSRNAKKPKDNSSDDDEVECSRNAKKPKDNSSDDDEVECSRNAKRTKYDSSDHDEDKMFLLSMLSTLQSIPVSKKMKTKIKLMTVLDEATRTLEE